MAAPPPDPTPDGRRGYRCPQCAGTLAYAPGTDALECAHCGHHYPIDVPAAVIQRHDFGEAARAQVRRGSAADVARGGREVRCNHCGARAVTDRHAGRCAFCDEPLVADVAGDGDAILPDAVMPFGLGKETAGRAFQLWLVSRWFAPRDLRARARDHAIDGVYLPCWTYDADTTTEYTGARGRHYYTDERRRGRDGKDQTHRVRHTRWWAATGTVRCRFSDVLVPASRAVSRARLDQLGPWDLRELRPFTRAYLAGSLAERYSIDLDAGFRDAQEVMARRIESLVRQDIGGDEQRVHSMDIDHRDVRFKHVLLPIWLSSFRYRHKVYRVVINGRTGKIAGERPWSVAKLVAASVALVALVATIALLVHHFRRPAPPPPQPPPEPTLQWTARDRLLEERHEVARSPVSACRDQRQVGARSHRDRQAADRHRLRGRYDLSLDPA